jgi:hypothetical protein
MPRTEDIVRALQALPAFTPDPAWRQRAKLRLMQKFDRGAEMQAQRQWAVYVSSDPNPTPVADWIRSRGVDWRPVAVSPQRMVPALEAIHPVLVVIDPKLRNRNSLLAAAQASSQARVMIDGFLAA